MEYFKNNKPKFWTPKAVCYLVNVVSMLANLWREKIGIKNMDIHQFYKEHYFHEANRRHQLTNALAIPIGVLTVIGGALIVVAKHLDTPLTCIEIFTLQFLVITAILLLTTIYFLIRSYFNYSYGYIATSQELKDYRDNLIEFYKADPNPEEKSEKDLEEYINSQYAEHTHLNVQSNDLKSYYIHKANGFLIATILVAFVSSIPYVVDTIIKPTEPQKIEITNFNQIKENQMSEDKKPEPTKQEAIPKPIEKPTPPPGRIIKESEEPKKIR